MSKFLLLLVIIVVVYLAVSGLARKPRREQPGPRAAEPMVPCAYCGLNLPRSEAVGDAGRFFCSEEHRRLGSG